MEVISLFQALLAIAISVAGWFMRSLWNNQTALEKAITKNTVGFLVEPIQGEAGVKVPAKGYLTKVKAICKKHNVLFIADEVHIYRIAVSPEWRRQGIGSQLVGECLRRARRRGVTAALLEVRPSNTEAAAFYRRFGFQVIATRPGYYTDSREDALILKLDMKEEDP